jgi:hypothetical protein
MKERYFDEMEKIVESIFCISLTFDAFKGFFLKSIKIFAETDQRRRKKVQRSKNESIQSNSRVA